MFSYAESLLKEVEQASKKIHATSGSKRKIKDIYPGRINKDSPTLMEMVQTAVGAVVDDRGATRQAIVKYIKQNYGLREKELATISNALNDGVDQSHLLRVSGTGANGRFRLVSKDVVERDKISVPTERSDDDAPPIKKVNIYVGSDQSNEPSSSVGPISNQDGNAAPFLANSSPVKPREKRTLPLRSTARNTQEGKPSKVAANQIKKAKTAAAPKKAVIKRKK